MDFLVEYLKKLENVKVISIIGLAKNVSKTTTLNYIIRNIDDEYTLGLTSIGRDGEKYDVITDLPKPQIYVKNGTYLVTAQQCFENSIIKFQTIEHTGFNTPLGEIVILKALSEGYIELAGPSINKQLLKICSKLKELNCDLILIDGAFDRRAYATPSISDATILSTGASVSRNMKEVIKRSLHTIELLSINPEKDSNIISLSKDLLNKSKLSIIDKSLSINQLDVATAIDSAQEIIKNLNENSRYVIIAGAITDKLLEDIMKSTQFFKGVSFIVEDSTKLFLSEKTTKKFIKKGGILKVLNPINIIALTINPISPEGYTFDKDAFLRLLQKELRIPVYNLGVND
jgi:hypothetical protein